MEMICLNKETKQPEVIFRGTPEEIFALQQLIVQASKNGGVLSDFEMAMLNTLISKGADDHD